MAGNSSLFPCESALSATFAKARETFNRKLARQEQLKTFDEENIGKQGEAWNNAVDERFDTFRKELDDQKDQALTELGEDPPQQAQDAVNAQFNAQKNELASAQQELKTRGSLDSEDDVNSSYEKKKESLVQERKDAEAKINDSKEGIKQSIDKVNGKLKLKETEMEKVKAYLPMAQGFGSLAQTFNFGSMKQQFIQAEKTYQKTQAQKAQSMNESIRQEVSRQWTTLAQSKDAAMQAYQSIVRDIQQAVRSGVA